MTDVTLSPQTIALVGSLMGSLVFAISALCGVIALLYRQVLKERDGRLDERNRLLDERDARLIDLWRDLEERETRIISLTAANERLQQLAVDATDGWRQSITERSAKVP